MLTALLILGNPSIIHSDKYKEKAENFYGEIQTILETHEVGSVTRDAGEPYVIPPIMDIWVAHSRGGDRLKWTPKGTVPVYVDRYLSRRHITLTGRITDKHFEMTTALRVALISAVKKASRIAAHT